MFLGLYYYFFSQILRVRNYAFDVKIYYIAKSRGVLKC